MQDNNEKSGFFARTSRAQNDDNNGDNTKIGVIVSDQRERYNPGKQRSQIGFFALRAQNDSPQLCHSEFISGSQTKLTKRFRLGGRNDGYSLRHPVQHKAYKLIRLTKFVGSFCIDTGAQKCAFTLAEVLITLGIIGVVAAMTLPVLTGKIDDIILRNQMKNSYSTFYQAFNKTIMDMESVDCYYPEGAGGSGAITSQCNDFYNNLVKNLKVIKHCPNNALAGGCIKTFKKYNTEAGCAGYSQYSIETKVPVWTFVDGSSFIPYSISGRNGALFLFDVNGHKGPNVGGKDIFPLIIYYNPKRGYSLGLGGCNGIVPNEYKDNLKNFLLK